VQFDFEDPSGLWDFSGASSRTEPADPCRLMLHAASPRDLPSNTNAETQHSASNIGSTERSGFPRYVILVY
jgi:hypothetical protein